MTASTIGKYKIIRELGQGAFGIVYLVEWKERKKMSQGALKMLKPGANIGEILSEALNWSRLSPHPNVLRLLQDVGV